MALGQSVLSELLDVCRGYNVPSGSDVRPCLILVPKMKNRRPPGDDGSTGAGLVEVKGLEPSASTLRT